MKKNTFKIILLIFLVIIMFITLYMIDIYKMKNNQPVIFSTWGYDYAPPEEIYLNERNNQNANESCFYADVIESSEKYIIVEPNEGELERKSSDKISISIDENNETTYPKGTNLKITYSGYIMETYPAQIYATKIEIVSKIELMYETIIDDIILKDEALNNEAKYISLDVDSFVLPREKGKGDIHGKYLGLEDSQKNALLKCCKKYNSEVKEYSMQELKENGLYDEENLKIDGILIYIESVEKITENSAIMTVAKYRSGLGAIFPRYKLTYKNGEWNIETLSMAIS